MKEFKYVVDLIEQRLAELDEDDGTLIAEVEKLRDDLFVVEDRLRSLREERNGLEQYLIEMKLMYERGTIERSKS